MNNNSNNSNNLKLCFILLIVVIGRSGCTVSLLCTLYSVQQLYSVHPNIIIHNDDGCYFN